MKPSSSGASPEFSDPLYRFNRVISIIEEIHGPAGKKDHWLDLGCHNGTFLNLVTSRWGVQGTGVDVYDPALKGNEPWHYLQRDIANFDIPGKYQYVSALEILEHMVDTDKFLECCRNALDEDGILVITTPNINNLRNRVMTFFGVYPVGLEYRNVIHHVRLYNLKNLRIHLREHGFTILHISGVSFLPLRINHIRIVRSISRLLALAFPQLCNDLICVATRQKRR